MQQYVVGFLFRKRLTEVALIRKNKPEWQRGRLNGIGDKIEPAELAHAAMCREFHEEAGAIVTDWTLFAELQCGSAAQIYFFRSEADVEVTSQTTERVDWEYVDTLELLAVIPNLRWLIPMAADADGPYAQVVSGFSGDGKTA